MYATVCERRSIINHPSPSSAVIQKAVVIHKTSSRHGNSLPPLRLREALFCALNEPERASARAPHAPLLINNISKHIPALRVHLKPSAPLATSEAATVQRVVFKKQASGRSAPPQDGGPRRPLPLPSSGREPVQHQQRRGEAQRLRNPRLSSRGRSQVSFANELLTSGGVCFGGCWLALARAPRRMLRCPPSPTLEPS